MPLLDDRQRLSDVLVINMRQRHDQLAELLAFVQEHEYEDGVYRFYHQSFKVYGLQHAIGRMIAALESIAPEGKPLCTTFRGVIKAGTGRQFTSEANRNWVCETAPIVQAFLRALYFLQMAAKYGIELEKSPQLLPSGFAALLELYDIR